MNTSDESDAGRRFVRPRTSCPASLTTYRALVAHYSAQAALMATLLFFGVKIAQATALAVGLLVLDLPIAKSRVTGLHRRLAAGARLDDHDGPDPFDGVERWGRA